MSIAPPLPADAPADIRLSPPRIAAQGFLAYEQYRVELNGAVLNRDVVRIGRVVGILCLDPARDLLVLIRQFRLAAQLATGRGDMIELPPAGWRRTRHGTPPPRASALRKPGSPPAASRRSTN